jgi:hypothetical protein
LLEGGSSTRRSEADTAEVLPKISLVEVEREGGIGRSRSQLKVFGWSEIRELLFEYLSEGLKKDW